MMYRQDWHARCAVWGELILVYRGVINYEKNRFRFACSCFAIRFPGSQLAICSCQSGKP